MTRIEFLKESVQPIIQSALIKCYLVGLTKQPSMRSKEYRRIGFPFFYILEVGLDKFEAIEIERSLFTFLTQDKSSIAFEKYHPEKKYSTYKPSTGGTKTINDSYAIYIAAY